ncbi:helix-turn-helix transcriptional regulator [Pseudonocardia nigra]|uniref:helix-turn-helix transcriptional regulator n=1 Tax=Pseudonocardia nigra TaxID=1921578 RepID=UPI001FE4F99F|nr:response regulator transcription factor [Pseudonocardia nigra]
MGDWDRALAICSEVLDDDRSSPLHRMVAHEESGLIGALRGDRRRARAPLRHAAAFGRSNEIFGLEVGATWGMAMAAVLDGDEAGARHAVSTMVERCLAKEEWHYALPALRWAATYLAERGDREGVARCHRLLAGAATQNSTAKVLSALAHASGELGAAYGDPAQASTQFGRAVDLLHGITAPFERGLSQLRRGTALAVQGDRSAAIETITSAYRTARHLGAKPLMRSCATALAQMGEQVDRRLGRLAARSLDPAGLTRREREVLRLLAGGRTNRQIAQELFLSTRTVDMHVRNLLGKLGCSSRVVGARRAAELGLIDLPARPPEVRQ